MRSRFEIQSVSFEPDGMSIAFLELPTDVRVRGHLVQLRQLQLSAAHPDYRDDMTRLRDEITKVLTNAVEDFAESSPHDLAEDPEDDDDDERGMGE